MNQDYPYRYGAIGVIVNNQGKFLVVNVLGYKPGDFDFVGGGREGSETPEENLYREIYEELGLSPNNFRLIGQSNHKLSFDFKGGFREFDTPSGKVKYKGQIKDAFVLEFVGNEMDIKPAVDQVREYKWIDASELKTHLNFRGQFEDAITIIQDVIPEYLKEGDEIKFI